MIFEEKTISSKVVYEGPVFKIRQHIVETVAGQSQRDIVEHNGGAVMLAITNEGKVINVRISESRDPYLDAEAKRVIAAMPKWIPGRHHGERVNTRYSVPVTFTLPN